MPVYQCKRTGRWGVEYHDAFRRRHRYLVADTKASALVILRAKESQTEDEKSGAKLIPVDINFAALSREFLEAVKTEINATSLDRYVDSIKILMPWFGHLKLVEITPRLVEKFRDARKATGITNSTVNRDLAVMKRMFSKAFTWGYISVNPVKRVQLFRENPARIRFLTPKELEAILRWCHGMLLAIVQVARFTGMRKGEILRLEWKDVDLDRRQISILESKNHTPRYVPICLPLVEVFKGIERVVGCPYVFVGRRGNRVLDIKTAWENAREKSGVKNFRFHDWRHHFASTYMMSGGNLYVLKAILGHKSITMTEKYSHLSPEHLREGVDQMVRKMADGSLFTGQEQTASLVGERLAG